MIPGGLSISVKEAIKNGLSITVRAEEVAELGAVKPEGFGSLIRERYPAEISKRQWENLSVREFSHFDTGMMFLEEADTKENPYLSLRYHEVSKECAEFLCDLHITPETWQQADIEQRMEMLKQAVSIMGEELKIPQEWRKFIEPIPVQDLNANASAECRIRPLDHGGVEILGIPVLKVNASVLEGSFYDAMSTVYHEMIHMKQYASIDSFDPSLTTDTRLLDLIEELYKHGGKNPNSYVDYLSSPYEAEAWAQGLYFKKMLQAVMQERYV